MKVVLYILPQNNLYYNLLIIIFFQGIFGLSKSIDVSVVNPEISDKFTKESKALTDQKNSYIAEFDAIYLNLDKAYISKIQDRILRDDTKATSRYFNKGNVEDSIVIYICDVEVLYKYILS